MVYIAKAYVNIESVSKRLELAKGLQDAGIRCLFSVRNGFEKIFVIRGGIAGVPLGDNIRDHIDCNAYTPNGTEEEAVKLFLELAQMRDDDSNTEWVRLDKPKESAGENTWVDTSYHKDWSSSNELVEALCEGWLKSLTPLEVAETFRNGRIEL